MALASCTSSTKSGNSRPLSATGQPSAKRTVTCSRRDRDAVVPVPHAHDRLDDVHARRELLEILGLVRRTPDVGVRRVRLLGARAVGEVAREQPLGQLLAPAELVHEVVVEPRLVDAQARVGEQAVAVEALDVVALVGRAVAPDRDAVVLHRAHEQRARDGAAERCRVEVRAPARADVERAALQRREALVHELRAAVDQARDLGAVDLRALGHVAEVGLVVLAEIGRVRARDRRRARASTRPPPRCPGRPRRRCRCARRPACD